MASLSLTSTPSSPSSDSENIGTRSSTPPPTLPAIPSLEERAGQWVDQQYKGPRRKNPKERRERVELIKLFAEAYPQWDFNIINACIDYDQMQQEKYGADYNAEDYPELMPHIIKEEEPKFSEAPVSEDVYVEPTVLPTHPALLENPVFEEEDE